MRLHSQPFQEFLPPSVMARAALAVSAALVFACGLLVYLLDRPAGSAWLLPAQWQLASPTPWLGAFGPWLPSFAHGFAFSLLTALVLPPLRRFAAAACVGWALIDSLAEIGQHPAVSGWLGPALESVLGGGPWAAQVGRYFSRGVFDPPDLVAGLAGCVLAYLAWHVSALRRRGPAQAGVHQEVS